MITRRFLCACGAATLLPGALRAEACRLPDQTRQSGLTPDAALAELKEGNLRFAQGRLQRCDLRAGVRATAAGQYPIAAVLGCIDSRVPPELVLDQSIGDIFVARVAGNTVDTDILGSLEYAVAVAGAKAIVVLGHSECGAIKGAIDKVELGNLTSLLSRFDAAVAQAGSVPGERNAHNKALVQAVAERNVRLTLQRVRDESPVIAGLVSAGRVALAGAMHDVGSGELRWLDA